MSAYISDPFVVPVVIQAYRKRRVHRLRPVSVQAPAAQPLAEGPTYADFFVRPEAVVAKAAS